VIAHDEVPRQALRLANVRAARVRKRTLDIATLHQLDAHYSQMFTAEARRTQR
jgi:hypothetical protein